MELEQMKWLWLRFFRRAVIQVWWIRVDWYLVCWLMEIMDFFPMWNIMLISWHVLVNCKRLLRSWDLCLLSPQKLCGDRCRLVQNLRGTLNSARRWNYVDRVRGMMEERELTKDLGCSSVEVEHQRPATEVYSLPTTWLPAEWNKCCFSLLNWGHSLQWCSSILFILI